MRKKILILTILLFFTIFSFWGWRFYSSRNYCAIPIGFLPYADTVYAIVEIQGQKYRLNLDLGLTFFCELKKQVLESLDKELVGNTRSVGIRGDHFVSSVYSLPQVKIGRARYFHVQVREQRDEFEKRTVLFPSKKDGGLMQEKKEYENAISGYLGLGLFLYSTPVLFLDLQNSSVFMVKDLRRFHEVPYSPEKMAQVPLQVENGYLVIEVETDFGRRRFLLDTGATLNLLKPSFLIDGEEILSCLEKKIISSATFQVGGVDLGSEDFCLFPMSSDLGEIDGILGMSFFRKYAIFLDFQNHVAYIGSTIGS